MHNDHYKRLEPHEPLEVFKTWATANYIVLCADPTLSGYYLAVIKYLARLELKRSDSPLKNLQKARFYIDRMIDALEQKDKQIEEIMSVVNEYQPSSDCRQLEEWHDWKDEDNQPKKGRWIEWDGLKYVANGYAGKKQTTLFREANGNYTSYLWNEDRISPLKGFWDWEEMKHWGKWRYVDEPNAQMEDV